MMVGVCLGESGGYLFARARDAQPTPTPGCVVVRIRAVALSADDALSFPALAHSVAPRILGHAGVGEVIAAGEPARAGAPNPSRLLGQRVALHPIVACAKCDRCRSGLATHCTKRVALGAWDATLALFGVASSPGVLQEFVTTPAYSVEPLPTGVDDQAATLGVTVSGALHLVRSVRVEHKPFVTVLGDGAIALLVAQQLARLNASVRVLGKHPERLALCERWGIRHRDVREVGLRQDQDVVIDATGNPSSLELAQRLLRPRGRLLIKSPLWPRALKPASLAWAADAEAEVTFVGSGPLRDALEAIARMDVDVTPLLGTRVAPEHASSGLSMLREKRAMRVIVAD